MPESLNSAVPARVHTVNQRPAHKGKETQQESGRKGATFALRCGQLAELWWIEHDVETWRNPRTGETDEKAEPLQKFPRFSCKRILQSSFRVNYPLEQPSE